MYITGKFYNYEPLIIYREWENAVRYKSNDIGYLIDDMYCGLDEISDEDIKNANAFIDKCVKIRDMLDNLCDDLNRQYKLF